MPHVQHIQNHNALFIAIYMVFIDMLFVSCIVGCNLIEKKLNCSINLVDKKLNYNQNLINKK
jgi:hypothetical protein